MHRCLKLTQFRLYSVTWEEESTKNSSCNKLKFRLHLLDLKKRKMKHKAQFEVTDEVEDETLEADLINEVDAHAISEQIATVLVSSEARRSRFLILALQRS